MKSTKNVNTKFTNVKIYTENRKAICFPQLGVKLRTLLSTTELTSFTAPAQVDL